MKILNLLITSASILANFVINSSFATDNITNNQINSEVNNQINITNQINIDVQPQVNTIHIGYDNVPLSNEGIYDFRLQCYKNFFSKENNKFKSYDDLIFAPTFLGKLAKHFHDQVRTGQYINNRIAIRKIKNVFSNILNNIIDKTTEAIKTNYFTEKEINEISERITMASETIKISNKRKAPKITIWDNIR